MLILALDYSTRNGSAALLRDGRIAGEAHWRDQAGNRPHLAAIVRDMLRQTQASLSDVELYAVGLGPGAYTTLRTSLSMAQGWALPTHTPLVGIGSAAALAHELARQYTTDKVTIIGNARRKRLWTLSYEQAGSTPTPRKTLRLVTADDVHRGIDAGELVASPDWLELGPVLRRALPSTAGLIEKPCMPDAASVARLAAQPTNAPPGPPRRATPITPIYLHPPVLANPRVAVPSSVSRAL